MKNQKSKDYEHQRYLLLTDLLMQILHMTKNLESEITEVAENLQREKPSIGLQQELWRNIFYPKNVEISCLCFFGGRYFCMKPYQDLDFSKIESNDVRCPDEETAEK